MKLALFDLDGTLTEKDTLFEVIRFIHGNFRLYLGLVLLSPLLLLHILRLLENWKAKEVVLKYFFRNMDYNLFQDYCNQFSIEKLPLLMKANALQALEKHQNEKALVVIISASAEEWIKPWCNQSNILLIATQLEVKEGKLTGRIAGKNCHGIEKVRRIKEQIDLAQYNEIYAYGDSSGDLPMLKLATHSYYKPY